MDPNILACKDHLDLLGQLAESKAKVNINQGLDARLLNEDNVNALRRIRLDSIHFAWDKMKDRESVLRGLRLWAEKGKRDRHGAYGTVYCLTNFGTTEEEDLERVYTLRDLGYDPYVMIYDKPNAPQRVRFLQRWCNNKRIFKTIRTFEDYDSSRG